MLQYLQEVMAVEGNYKNYRQIIRNRISKKSKSQFIPWIGIYLRDLTILEEANSDYLGPGIINFEKILLVGVQLQQIRYFQEAEGYLKYFAKEKISLLRYIAHLWQLEEERLNEISESLRPLPAELASADDSNYSTAEQRSNSLDSTDCSNMENTPESFDDSDYDTRSELDEEIVSDDVDQVFETYMKEAPVNSNDR